MPTSDYHQISDVMHVIEQVRPGSVLDVGVGFGKWGILCRELTEIYEERLLPASWVKRIDGIEIYEPYRNPLWELAYNNVYIGDARTVIDGLGRYDLIICCDVIEHFEKDEGRKLLGQMLDKAAYVIVTSPRGHAPQGAAYGNEHEAHRSEWGTRDLKNIPHLYKEVGFTFLAVLSRDSANLRHLKLSCPLEVLGAKRASRDLLKLFRRRLVQRITA